MHASRVRRCPMQSQSSSATPQYYKVAFVSVPLLRVTGHRAGHQECRERRVNQKALTVCVRAYMYDHGTWSIDKDI